MEMKTKKKENLLILNITGYEFLANLLCGIKDAHSKTTKNS